MSAAELVIKNDHWSVDLHPRGACVTRLFPRVVGRSIVRDSPQQLTTGRDSGAYPVPTLFGRHENKRVVIAGRTFEIPSERDFALHGMELDHLYHVAEHTEQRIEFVISMHEIVQNYPFPSRVTVMYSLLDAIFRVCIRVKNLSDEYAIPAMAAWHPFYLRYLESDGGLDTHLRLQAHFGEILRFDGAQPIPTKAAAPALPHEKYSLSRIVTSPYDNSLTWDGEAKLYWPGQLELSMSSNAKWFHIFTGRERAVCLESLLGSANGLWLRDVLQNAMYGSLVQPGEEAFLQTDLQILKFR